MRIIDKTPLQDENGNIGLIPRIQGTLKYGLSWYAELEAQKKVIAQLDRSLEKGFVLIRNFTLPNSEIVIPIILIGTGGIWVIYVTNARGYFEAKGDQWNTVNNGRSQPARINLLSRIAQLTRVFQKYLEIHKFNLPVNPEPVLIASDPGAQIESMRPAARVVRSDAIRQFAASLLQARPVLSTGAIYDLADQVIDPNLRKELQLAAEQPPASRAQAIFKASESSQEFDPNELGFAFVDETEPAAEEGIPQNLRESSPARPLPQAASAPVKKKFLGMNNTQIALLAGMLIIECCVLIGFAVIFAQFQ